MASIKKPAKGITSPQYYVQDKLGTLVATIARTETCAQYGGKCVHLLHVNGRCDHFEKMREAITEGRKL